MVSPSVFLLSLNSQCPSANYSLSGPQCDHGTGPYFPSNALGLYMPPTNKIFYSYTTTHMYQALKEKFPGREKQIDQLSCATASNVRTVDLVYVLQLT